MDMKNIFGIIALLTAVGIGMTPITMPDAMSNISVSIDRLKEDVRFLTTINPPRNYRNVQSLDKAGTYIAAEFKKMKCRIDIQQFNVDERIYRNIACSFGPEQGERVIVGAHYDVYGDQPGADDNASGTAGLLEIGRLLSGLNPKLKYRTDLVAFTLEEPIFFKTRHMGSSVYAQSLSEAGIKVRAMITLEMIGFYTDRPDSQQYPLIFLKWMYPSTGNYIVVVGKLDQVKLVQRVKRLMAAASIVPVQSITAPSILPGIDFSDHQSFWKYGYPAVMITDTAFYRNKNYHKNTDTIDTLNFKRMAEVVKGLYRVTVEL
jgi:hypothetical protein